MATMIDSHDLDRNELHDLVLMSKAVRLTYGQFFGEKASETIINMFDENELLTKEEDAHDTH